MYYDDYQENDNQSREEDDGNYYDVMDVNNAFLCCCRKCIDYDQRDQHLEIYNNHC